MKYLPLAIGWPVGFVALAVSGQTGLAWLIVGVILGGWVPLYLMPWIRNRKR